MTHIMYASQVTAQQQAHAAAAEAHHYDAQAQALQAEAASVAGPIGAPLMPEVRNSALCLQLQYSHQGFHDAAHFI